MTDISDACSTTVSQCTLYRTFTLSDLNDTFSFEKQEVIRCLEFVILSLTLSIFEILALETFQ